MSSTQGSPGLQRPQQQNFPSSAYGTAPLTALMLQSPGPIWRQCEERVPAPSEAPSRPEAVSAGHRGSMDRSGDPHTPGLRAAAHSKAVTIHSRAGTQDAVTGGVGSESELCCRCPCTRRSPRVSVSSSVKWEHWRDYTNREPITQRRHILGVRQCQSRHTARNLRHVKPVFSVPKKLFF